MICMEIYFIVFPIIIIIISTKYITSLQALIQNEGESGYYYLKIWGKIMFTVYLRENTHYMHSVAV